ncbi:MAG: hypothetical protein CSYNP_00302 [Syntrophus sp. SKADARSKE-3]|nr:hypothetical protein [Syntrophus sp. SKADARSKE-3]
MRTTSPLDISFSSVWKITAIIPIALCLTGCTNYFFQPDHYVYHTPTELGLTFHDVFLKTPDDVQIHSWFLRAKGIPKGTVFVLHGNAQNISSHFTSVAWLPASGYHVFIMDYRGYGDSTGTPDITMVFLDIKTAMTWLFKMPDVKQMPIFLLGQSLGAALGVYFLGTDPDVKQNLAGVILDGCFSRYRMIVKEKMAESWLTWSFQDAFALFISDKYDPEDYIAKLFQLPILIIHSQGDRVVPFHHGKLLYEQAREPKLFIESEGGHIATFRYERCRRDLLKFMSRVGAGK